MERLSGDCGRFLEAIGCALLDELCLRFTGQVGRGWGRCCKRRGVG